MPIEVKSGVNAGSVLTAAYAGGQGQARGRLKEQELNAMEQRRRLAKQQTFAAGQAGLDREFRAGENVLNRQQQFDMQEERSALERENEQWEYDQGQKRKFAELDAADLRIDEDETLTPADKVEGHRRVQVKRLGVGTKNQVPSVADLYKQNTFKDPSGNVIQRLPDGTLKELTKSAKPTMQDWIKGSAAGNTYAAKPDGTVDPVKHAEYMKLIGLTRPTAGGVPGAEGSIPGATADSILGGLGGASGGGVAADFVPAPATPGAPPAAGGVTAAEIESLYDEYEDDPKEDFQVMTGKGRAVWGRMTKEQQIAFNQEGDRRQAAPEPTLPKKKGQKVTKEVALQYKAKYGSRKRAEEAARADGWSF